MGKTVIMFPGQGVQKIGMSQEFYEKYKVSRDCFEKAENVTGLDMTNLIFKENENLDKTEYTQKPKADTVVFNINTLHGFLKLGKALSCR